MAEESKPSTIRDVASRAGVSTATVSRALRGGAGVDPSTRKRVQDAARELRYRPSGVARSLKLRSTQTIGLIVTDIENPYFPQLVRAVEDAARERGYSVILANGKRDVAREIQSLELLAGRQVDGLLIASAALTEHHRSWIDERPCPVVIINGGSYTADVPAVLSDNVEGGRMAVEHLLGLGHSQLAYVGDMTTENVAVTERLDGVRAAAAAAGVEVRVVQSAGHVDGAERAAREAMERWPDTTALVCYNDLAAVGVLRGVRSMGLRVPHDVSVVGFDDIELAPYVDPALTTIRQHTDEIGRWAVDRLIDSISDRSDTAVPSPNGLDAHAQPERIPVELVVRDSTAAPS